MMVGPARGKPKLDLFAYYLPQFYPVPLNAQWWGEGFTEWNSVLRAHRGLRSPAGTAVTPGELGFYDLRMREVRAQQSKLFRDSGLAALAIYHYWSRGDRPMGDVVDLIESDHEPDVPLFFFWANHDWTLAWKGEPETVTWKQEYDESVTDEHFEWLLRWFGDERYYRIGNAPVIGIYDIDALENADDIIRRWKALAVAAGYSDLIVVAAAHRKQTNESDHVDAWVQSLGSAVRSVSQFSRVLGAFRSASAAFRMLLFRDYEIRETSIRRALRKDRRGRRLVPVVTPGWNNVGRRSHRAWYFRGTPDGFALQLRDAVEDAPTFELQGSARRLIAVNAWNEWGESMTIEPTSEHGAAMLRAIRRAVDEASSDDSSTSHSAGVPKRSVTNEKP